MSDGASRARSIEFRTMQAYVEMAPEHGHSAEIIDVTEFDRIPSFDAAFLRLDTSIFGLSFAMSRYCYEMGLRIVDDPKSMLTCMNKAHVQGILERAGVPTPDTVLLTKAGSERLDAAAMFAELGSPIVCKAPHGAFSSAVEKAKTATELRSLVRRFSGRSDVVLLQRYMPSTYDWRVGILTGQPLYAARYHIPQGAWRIHDKPEGEQRKKWAKVEAVPLGKVPTKVMDTAMRASKAIGNSLYGVDLKQPAEGDPIVIEVNDNPNIDWGSELPAGSTVFGQIIDRIARDGPKA